MEKITLGFSARNLSVSSQYEVLRRLGQSGERSDVPLLAFGLGKEELRLVTGADGTRLARSLKIATGKAQDLEPIRWLVAHRCPISPAELPAAVAWAHRAPLAPGQCPLSTPWSSHRDLLGYRRAAFFSAHPTHKVDPLEVHRLAGGAPLADRSPRSAEASSLPVLLRVAGAVLGRLPSDRRCFRLFVHLARSFGHTTPDIGRALHLTDRRIRQLAAEHEPLLGLADRSLRSPVLCLVP